MAASSAHRRILSGRAAWLIGLYAIAYFVASWLDLTTTALALHRPEASEANVYSTGAAGYVAFRAWLITIIGGLAIEACLAWAIVASAEVTENRSRIRCAHGPGSTSIRGPALCVIDRRCT